MKLINMTPSPVVLRPPTGPDTTLPPGGGPGVKIVQGALRTVKGIPVPVRDPETYGQFFGMPDPKPDTMYIVPPVIGAAAKASLNRVDLLMVGIGQDVITAKSGKITAYTALQRVHPASGAVFTPRTAPPVEEEYTLVSNLTTASITLRGPDGIDLVLPMEKTAWAVTLVGTAETVEGIPVLVRAPSGFGKKFSGLPDPVPGVLLIVNPNTAQAVNALTTRTDVVSTGYLPEDVMKNEKGAIIAIKALRRL